MQLLSLIQGSPKLDWLKGIIVNLLTNQTGTLNAFISTRKHDATQMTTFSALGLVILLSS